LVTKKGPVEIARDLVRIESMNPPGHENECAQYVGKLMQDAGLHVSYHEFAEGRTSVVARLEGDGAKAPLCFGGHIDTVPLGAKPWSMDPFAGEVSDGKLYGRGTTDMKAGVAAYLWAALRIASMKRGKADILFLAVAGEETGCQGSFHLARSQVLGRAGALVIAEPTTNYPIVGHRGALWLQAETTGVTAHGSMPHLGVNAIYKAAKAIGRLERFSFNMTPHPGLGVPTLNVGTMKGGMNLNSVPDCAEFTIDIRTIPGQDHRTLVSSLQSYLGDEVRLSPVVDVPGVWTEVDDPWIREVFELVEPVLGEKPQARGAPYFTDASALKPAFDGAPTVILGPGDMKLAHQTDEYCAVDKIEEAANIYEAIARQWCEMTRV
jgi:succinyl-diaminopimelate desuccinylase